MQLIHLNKQIGLIRKNRSTKQRLGNNGEDEIGELSISINSMLQEIDEVHQEISNYATFDEMTGVFNRRVGFDILEEHAKKTKDYDVPFSVIYIDIDGLI